MEQVQCLNCGETTSVSSSKRCEHCNYPVAQKKKSPIVYRDDSEGMGSRETEVVQLPGADETQVIDEGHSFAAGFGGGAGPEETMQVDYIQHENTNPNKKNVKVIGGWFVMHAQGQPTISFELFLGDNVIGRQSPSHDVDIPIENGDRCISRKHAIIRVTKDFNNTIKASIIDDGSINNGQPSTNGVYINGNPARLGQHDQYELKNGDSVQIGKTTFVFKGVYDNISNDHAVTEVLQTQYTSVINF